MQKGARRNGVLNSPRLSELKSKKYRILKIKIIISIVLFIALIAGLAFVSRIKRLNIYSIEVTGNKVIETNTIRESMQGELSGKYLWLFPKTNIFLYPENELIKNLSDKYKRLTNVSMSVENGTNLGVSVVERTPEYMWCGNTPVLNEQKEKCYFLDKEGYIFDEAPYFSGEVYFKFYGNTGKEGDPTGAYLAKGYFNNLISFKETLTSINLKPAILHIEDGEDVKIFLSKSGSSTFGPEIRVKKDANFQKTAENLKAALDTEPLLTKFKNEYSKLEYIELRFGNKVYYKFK